MLLRFLEQLRTAGQAAGISGPWAALEKITLRGCLAAALGFTLALVVGPRLIGWLRRRFREPNVSACDTLRRLHQAKHATPTMGGLFIVAGLVGGVLAFGDLANRYVQTALLLALGLSVLGALDDLAKIRSRGPGLSVRTKLAGQTLVAAVAALVVYQHQASAGFALHLPVLGTSLPLGLGFVPLAVLVIVGASNAVNLADGLDGLAGGCLIFATGAMALVAYAAGHVGVAHYLHVPPIPGVGEMFVVAGGMVGALLGFLWFNCHPAQVFMGDTGSLPLGGLLGLLAVVTRQELLLVVVGGVFVAEALSVILQVGYYKWRRRRIFLCAPLHHHFQLRGWPESRIVVRFWIASALCALLGLAMLKMNVEERSPRFAPPAATAERTVRP